MLILTFPRSGRKKKLALGGRKSVGSGMEFDLQGKDGDRAYALLASLVCPRPIAWVTTLNDNGSVNAAPFSFFNVVGDEPPMVMVCPGNREDGTPKDTARNIRRSGEFVVNLVDETLAGTMVRTSAAYPYGVSEVERENLAVLASSSISVPRIAASPASLECILHDIVEIGRNRIILGIVQRIHVKDSLVDPGTNRILTALYHPVGRMAVPDWYCRTAQQFEIERPR